MPFALRFWSAVVQWLRAKLAEDRDLQAGRRCLSCKKELPEGTFYCNDQHRANHEWMFAVR